jgi:hypothetical protein
VHVLHAAHFGGPHRGTKGWTSDRDGEVITACQAVCPTDAIVFGDMNDKQSQVAQIKQDPRNYKLLNELNTQPRTPTGGAEEPESGDAGLQGAEKSRACGHGEEGQAKADINSGVSGFELGRFRRQRNQACEICRTRKT